MTAVEFHLFQYYQKSKELFQKYTKNWYWVTTFLFFVWMVFFDNDSFYVQLQRKWQVVKIDKEIQFYTKELEKTKIEEKALNESNEYFEKFVRETYLLKKKNEDVFIFTEEE